MMYSRGRRTLSAPWSRLKPIQEDPLQTVGLPSKGDKQLLNFPVQENYYRLIVQRYLGFCVDAGEGDELLRRFEMLNIGTPELTPAASSGSSPKSSSSGGPSPVDSSTTRTTAGPSRAGPATPSSSTPKGPVADKIKALSDVLMGLRKLREGIVGSKRADDFAIQVYLFCIRVAIFAKEPESYHPAILHLLRYIRLIQPMTSLEIEEVATYLILDTACRRKDLLTAYEIRREYKVKSRNLNLALYALAHDNWFMFRKVKREVDRHQLKIMEYADDDMRVHALKCFGRTYLSVDCEFLETSTERKWSDLKEKDGVGWELDGDKVVIRRVRAR